MELAKRIYELRKGQGMTQQDLADRLKVSRQAVSRWEMGTAVPELEHLKKMAEAFGISMDVLVTGEEPQAATPAAAPGKGNGKKWVTAWLAVSGGIVLLCLGWLLWEWKVAGAMMAISPMTLAAQLVNIPLTLGILFGIAYLICRAGRK